MTTKKFFISWLASAIVMFSLSYFWHGVFLNDLQRLTYPKEVFLTGCVITYLILGFLLTRLYLLNFPKQIAKKPLLRGIISGALLGIATYVISLVIGVSFNNQLKAEYILFDILWQTVEQTIGGITVGLAYILLYEEPRTEIVSKKTFDPDRHRN
jgi:hypothetical protein